MLINGARLDPAEIQIRLSKRREKKKAEPVAPANTDVTSEIQHVQPKPPPNAMSLPSSYQAIESAYLEHGIRVSLHPAQRSDANADHGRPRKTTSTIQRSRTIVNGYLHRPDTPRQPLRFSQSIHEHAPVSAAHLPDVHTQQSDSANNRPFLTSTNEHVEQRRPSVPVGLHEKPSTMAQLIGNDPDLAYMSSLLQKTTKGTARSHFQPAMLYL